MNRIKSISGMGVFSSAILLAGAIPAYGSPCSDVLPSNPDTTMSGDEAYVPLWGQTQINNWWSAYAMEYADWDEGWGYSHCGNVSLPLARTFNAMYAVQYSAPPGAGSDNFLGFG